MSEKETSTMNDELKISKRRSSLKKAIEFVRTRSKDLIKSGRPTKTSKQPLNFNQYPAVVAPEESFAKCDDDILDRSRFRAGRGIFYYEARHLMAVEALLRGEMNKNKELKKTNGSKTNKDEIKKADRNILKSRRIHDFADNNQTSSEQIDISLHMTPCLPKSKSPPSLESFLSPSCRLQKDKGEGFEPGTAVQVVGQKAALKKLCHKTDKLNNGYSSVRVNITKGSPKLTKMDPPETRSILEFKMGFMSMKYGVLLQWNGDGLVDLIVMRKMVGDSFMNPLTTSSGTVFDRKHKRHSSISKMDNIPERGIPITNMNNIPSNVQIDSGLFEVEATLHDLLNGCVTVMEQ